LQRGKSLGSAGNSPKRRFSAARKTPQTAHNIVVVKPAKEPDSKDKDPNLLKLQSIPMFLPIMRGTLNLPGKYSSILLQLLQLRNYRKANL
jgi:hypothetical protein